MVVRIDEVRHLVDWRAQSPLEEIEEARSTNV
jgi:hypothetical protein